MLSDRDTQLLAQARECVLAVLYAHRSEDLRVVALFDEALNDLRVAALYLQATVDQPHAL